ncbi:kinetochore-associated Ndc80 complex subunit ndc80 [Arthrobotrys musiformis]|uniref:Kinetochore protein NDC80 n=1 Tax=Arthrobotrys musiformis TaxID=47236 RepID=A0AAV9W6I7_9PEZI
MSQDTNLFSAFKRPRETLSAVNNLTSIPQPTSALKRSASNQGLQQGGRPSAPNFRHSMLPSRSGGSLAGNLLDMGAQTANRRESRIGGLGGGGGGFNIPSSRKSYAPTSSTPQMMDQRRSSMYSRPSVGANLGGGGIGGGGGVGGGGSFFGTSGSSAIAGAGSGKVTDPRPLRDPNFRNKMAQEIQEYLLQYNFELETKHNLGPRALSSPMQKDFTTIFQWLYHRLDPNFKFSLKAVETEVMPLLKGIKYPYLGNITKAQLGAVGGANNWPTYLGLLHWMVQLVQALDNFDSGHYDEAIESQSLDIGTSKVGYRYLSQCYTTWLNDEDDFSPFKAEMVEEFEGRSAQDAESLGGLQAEYDALVHAISELEDESGKSPLDRLKSEGETLRNDQDKFRKFIEHQREKMGHIRAVNGALKDEGESVRQEVGKLEIEKVELQQAVDRQGLSTADIDRMNTEREKLIKGLEGVEVKLEEANGIAAGREAEALKKLELLEHAVKRYNELGYKIGVTISNGQSCEIDIIPLTKAAQSAPEGSSGDDERLLYDVGVGYNPRQVLTLDLRHDVKPTLNNFRNEIATRIHNAQDVSIKNQDRLDNIQETLKDKAEELETLEAKLSAVNDEYSEIKETSATETSASNAEIEKLERELQSMRINAQSGLLALEQRLQSVNIEYDQLAHGAHVLREFYHGEIEKMLQTIINLKMHIQGSLAGLETETSEELEAYRESLDKKLSRLRI